MLVSDVISYARTLLAEPSSTQAWTDAQLTQFVDRAQKMIIRSIRWPESRISLNSIAGVQEYSLPETIKIMRVYVQGQPIVRTDIPTLQGQQIQLDDQTGSGGGPSGLITPGSASPIVVAPYTPQWTGQASAAYPVASSIGYPSPDAVPWMAGQRPRYYLRGGVIGLVPPPAGIYPIIIDLILQPITVTSTGATLLLPDISLDALAWKVCELAYFSDRSEAGSQDVRNYAIQNYKEAMKDLFTWKRQYDGFGPRGPKPLTYRSFYRNGNNRISSNSRD